jgi:tetratricopeptide (TPR) repeat protein
VCLEEQCLPGEAKEHFVKAFENLPSALGENSDGTPEIGRMMMRTDLFSDGLRALDQFIARNPKSAEATYARGLLNYNLGRFKQALSDFRATVAEDPHHLGAWQKLSSFSGSGLIGSAEAQRIEFNIIKLASEKPSYAGGPDLTYASDLKTAYRVLQSGLANLPLAYDGPIFPFHTSNVSKQRLVWPDFDWHIKSGRFVGGYFQASIDIQEIAELFHVTRYPFE